MCNIHAFGLRHNQLGRLGQHQLLYSNFHLQNACAQACHEWYRFTTIGFGLSVSGQFCLSAREQAWQSCK